MKKERQLKIITMIILCVCVLGLAIGFSAFSSLLTINSKANITPDSSTFNVSFSTNSSSISNSSPVCSSTNGATVDTTAIIVSNKEISGLNAEFSEPGQSLLCSFYAHNTGEYIAYLNSITFNFVNDDGSFKVCNAVTGTDPSKVDDVCDNITFTISVSGVGGQVTSTDITKTNIGHSLQIGDVDVINIELTYTGTNRADGDFFMEFGTVQLLYESIQK